MEENKYHIPTEEYYITFEYEEGNKETIENVTKWLEETVKKLTPLKTVYKNYIACRVNYTGRKYLESEGWLYRKGHRATSNKNKGWGLRLYKDIIHIDFEGNTFFYGECKNRSEFKKLMKQLNIV